MNNTLFEYIAVMNVVRSAIVTIFAYFLLSISVYEIGMRRFEREEVKNEFCPNFSGLYVR